MPTFSIPFGGHFDAVDLDQDGDQDLVIPASGVLTLLRNDGAANFAAPVTILPGEGHAAFGDFNGDNRTDVAVAIGAPGYVVLLADASGGFLPPVDYAVAGGAHALGGPADLNGDGDLDLLIIARGHRRAQRSVKRRPG